MQYASKELQSDREIVLEAVKSKGKALNYADPKFLNDKELFTIGAKTSPYCLEEMGDLLKKDIKFIKSLLKENPIYFKDLQQDLRNNQEVSIYAISLDELNARYVGEELINNPKFLLKAASANEKLLDYMGENFIENLEKKIKEREDRVQGYSHEVDMFD